MNTIVKKVDVKGVLTKSNLRGSYKAVILDYIAEKHPDLMPLYREIYQLKNKDYWAVLNEEILQFATKENLLYVRNDDFIKRPFAASPLVVNYFFHEEIIPSANKKK